MKKIDSQALEIANKALGITGAGSLVTELADGVVDQSLDVVPIVRRSRTLGRSEGIFTALMFNEHTGATTLTSSINPFEVGALGFPLFPSPIPENLDLWILATAVNRTSGSGTLKFAFYIDYPTSQLAFGVDDGGSQITDTPGFPVAMGDALLSAGQTIGRDVNNGGYIGRVGLRLPRSLVSLRFVSVSNATSSYQGMLVLGLFPVALGQDGIL